MPPLMEENREAARVYMAVCNQFVMAPMGGPVDIDFRAIEVAMDIYSVQDRRACFEKVVALARRRIARMNNG